MPDINLPALDTVARPAPRRTPTTALLYSPRQVTCGVLIGGPVALIYFLKSNFAALGNSHGEKNTVLSGLLLMLVVIAGIVFFPWFPTAPLGLIYVLIARYVVEKYQMTRDAIAKSSNYDFRSNWTVMVLGILCLIGSAVAIVIPIFTLLYLGVD